MSQSRYFRKNVDPRIYMPMCISAQSKSVTTDTKNLPPEKCSQNTTEGDCTQRKNIIPRILFIFIVMEI